MSYFNNNRINQSKVVLSNDSSHVVIQDKTTGKEVAFDLANMKGGNLFKLISLEVKRIHNGWSVFHKGGVVEGVEKTIVYAAKTIKGVRREETLASYTPTEYEALLGAI